MGAAAAALLVAQAAPARITIASGITLVLRLVSAGQIGRATRLLESDYRFDSPDGMRALNEFSLALLRQGLYDRDPFERCYAATALAAHGEWDGRGIIAEALNSPNLLIQKAAVEGLAAADNGEALGILERFYHMSGPVSQAIAMQALAEVKAPAVMPLLVEATKNPNSTGAFWAINGLGRMGNRNALPYLQMLLMKSIDPMVRTEAAHSMVLLGDRSPIDTLEESLGSGDGEVAQEAALALGDAREPGAVDLLEEILKSGRAALQVRLAAAVALTHYGRSDGLKLIAATLDGEGQRATYLPAMLDHLDFKLGRPLLLRAAASSEQELRLTAYEVLGRNGGDAEIRLLGEALARTHDPADRAQIAWSLGRIGRAGAIPLLLDLVQTPVSEVRYTAAESLARIADQSGA
jgi:HEAT repeat protein